jgi:hypothetical protein
MMAQVGAPVIVADGLVLEPRGMWQQYLDRRLADLILVPEPGSTASEG